MDPRQLLEGLDEEKVFRSLFAAYPDGLLLVDAAGAIVGANQAARDLLGYAADALLGMSVEELVPAAIRPMHAAYRAGYVANPCPRAMGMQTALVARRRDGSEVQVEIALSPLQAQGLPFTVAAIRAVGEYPRVKQAMQRARYAQYLATFGRLAVEGRDPPELMERVSSIVVEALQVEMAKILMLEPGGTAFRIAAGVGLLPQESIGQKVASRPGSPSHHVIAHAESVRMEDHRTDTRFRIPRSSLDTGTACEALVPLVDRGRAIGVLAVRSRAPGRFGNDEMRFLESLSNMLVTVLQRASSEEALNHAQRLESVGQLTGGVAHDFNNLLTIISGNLQVLEDLPSHAHDPVARQLVGAAARATRRGAELTGKMLAFSRRQMLQPTIVDTAALLRSLTDMLRRTLDQRIQITLDADEGVPCMADAVQLESALLNIALNARDAMPGGGHLTLSCTRAEMLPHGWHGLYGEHVHQEAHRWVAIAVEDTGEGMSDTVMERAFEPFFTTKSSGRGTGLGLSTVYGFARQSQGAVALRSMLGHGTTVTLYLPRVDAVDVALDAHDGAVGSEVAPMPVGLRVLLVEDDREVRRVIERFLDTLRCRVSACDNAYDAVSRFGDGGDFDLLLTDILLGPGARGTELATHLRQRRPDLPVLLMSGYSGGSRDDASGWLVLRKPYARGELAQAIGQALAQRAGR